MSDVERQPISIIASTDYDPVNDEGGEWVTRRGKLFQVGVFPHPDPAQRFEFAEADLDHVIEAYAPVQIEQEHLTTRSIPTIFDGRLGSVPRVWKQGSDLYAEYRVPSWVDKVWGERGHKVSAVFDPLTKQLIRVGLVLHPRIPDAVAMSDDGEPNSELALAGAYLEFAGRRHSASDARDMQTIHDIAVGQGAACAPEDHSGLRRMMFTEPEEADMAEETKKEGVPAPQPAAPSEREVALPPQFAAEHERMRAELDALRQQNATLAAERRAERARSEVKARIEARKLYPEAFNQAVANLTQAYADDAATPVTFAATETGTKVGRAANLLAEWDGTPPHSLTQEELRGEAVGLLRFNSEQERSKEDESNPLTPVGAETYARKWIAQANGKRPSAG